MTEKQIELASLTLKLAEVEAEAKAIDEMLRHGLDAVVEAYKREMAPHYEALNTRRLQADQLREKIRELAPAVGAGLGTKKPVPGVGLRSREVLEYDEAQAVEWAINTPEMRPLLKLDRKKAEAVLKPLAKTGVAPAWATVRTETAVTFARDLAAVADELSEMVEAAEVERANIEAEKAAREEDALEAEETAGQALNLGRQGPPF